MGSGDKAPAYVEPNLLRQFDKDLVMQILNRSKEGLSDEEQAGIEGRYSGVGREQEQMISEQFAGQGVPIATRLGVQSDAKRNLGKDLTQTLLQANASARGEGFGQYATLQNIAGGQVGMQNQYNMGAYQTDQEGKFNFGKVLGAALGAGGSLGGAAISNKD